MNIFESVNRTTNQMSDVGERYVEKSQEYYTLKVFQQLTISISLVTKALIIGGLSFIAILFLAFALAMVIGNWLDNLAGGYIIVAALFLISTVVVYYNRKHINNKIVKTLSTKFFDV